MENSEPTAEYFERRASEELAAAEQASSDHARQSHLELAKRYSEAARTADRRDGRDDEAAPLLPSDFRILP